MVSNCNSTLSYLGESQPHPGPHTYLGRKISYFASSVVSEEAGGKLFRRAIILLLISVVSPGLFGTVDPICTLRWESVKTALSCPSRVSRR